MDKAVPSVLATMTVSELSDQIAGGDPSLMRRQGTLIVDEAGRLAGIITRGDIVRALSQEVGATTTVSEAGSTDLVLAYADEPLHDALMKMMHRDVGRLPVVDRAAPDRAIGYLGRAAILSARMRLLHEEHHRQRG
jgi:CBS domain-containing protein